MKKYTSNVKYMPNILVSIFVAIFIFFSQSAWSQVDMSANPFESQKNAFQYNQEDIEDIDLASTKTLRDSLLTFFKDKLSVYDYADLTMALDGLYAVKFRQRVGEIYQDYLLDKAKDKFDEKFFKTSLIKKIGRSFGISLSEVSEIKSDSLSMTVASQKTDSEYEPLFSALKFVRMLLGIPSFSSK